MPGILCQIRASFGEKDVNVSAPAARFGNM